MLVYTVNIISIVCLVIATNEVFTFASITLYNELTIARQS